MHFVLASTCQTSLFSLMRVLWTIKQHTMAELGQYMAEEQPTQIEDDLATSLKRKRVIERLHLTPLPIIDEPGPPPVLTIDINIPDNFRAPTPEAEVHQTPIDNDITNKDYQSPVDTRFPTLPPTEETAPWSYRPLPRQKPTIPQIPPKTVPASTGRIFGTTPEPIPPSTAPVETIDVLLTDFLIKKWLDFHRNNLQLIGVTPWIQSLTGTSPCAAHIPLWMVSCAGLKNTKDTPTIKSSDLWLQPNQQTTLPGYAYASERPEPHRGSQTKPAPFY